MHQLCLLSYCYLMVELRRMSPEVFDKYMDFIWNDYRSEVLKAGFTEEQADTATENAKKQILNDGVPNEDQRFFEVFAGEKNVGLIHIAKQGDEGGWYIYYILINEPERGNGFGKQGMLAAENYVKSQNGKWIALNVFGFNATARNLYESLNYEIRSISMRKEIV